MLIEYDVCIIFLLSVIILVFLRVTRSDCGWLGVTVGDSEWLWVTQSDSRIILTLCTLDMDMTTSLSLFVLRSVSKTIFREIFEKFWSLGFRFSRKSWRNVSSLVYIVALNILKIIFVNKLNVIILFQICTVLNSVTMMCPTPDLLGILIQQNVYKRHKRDTEK